MSCDEATSSLDAIMLEDENKVMLMPITIPIKPTSTILVIFLLSVFIAQSLFLYVPHVS